MNDELPEPNASSPAPCDSRLSTENDVPRIRIIDMDATTPWLSEVPTGSDTPSGCSETNSELTISDLAMSDLDTSLAEVPEVMSSALQLWSKRRLKSDLDELMELPDKDRTTAASCRKALGRIRKNVEAGSYDQTLRMNSEINHVFLAFDCYRDIDDCFQIYQRMAAPMKDKALNRHLSSQHQRLQIMKSEFTEDLNELALRHRKNEGYICDLVLASSEYLVAAYNSLPRLF
jgi:hypothetical protein